MHKWDWILAAAVMIFILWFLLNFFKNTLYEANSNNLQSLIVIIQNNEGTIESIIRKSILFQRQLGDYAKLYIIDLNSGDKSLEIIKRMGYPNNYFSVFMMKDRRELTGFLEEYIDDGCVIMDYSYEGEDTDKNFKDCRLIYYIN
ncbi:MAG: hypothetical protein ACOWWO_04420 [Peptococcaceae bacterium]